MKACGIVAEYNPFHNGHLYQLKKAKEQSGADVMVAAMSGNFLQRGEPALLDKWSRASTALENGVDIVVEIPVAFSVQPADYFSMGAITILNALMCDTLSFGSESGKGEDFLQAAQLYIENEDVINHHFQSQQRQEYTYARNLTGVLESLFPEFPIDLSQPNNVLGFTYAKEIISQKSKLSIVTVPRKESHYHEQNIHKGKTIASASAIRNALFHKTSDTDDLINVMPVNTLEMLKMKPLVSWDNFFPYLKYQSVIASNTELSDIYLMEKGLDYRIKRLMKDSNNMTEFLTKLKTKQLTWTRLQRICFYILLNQTKEDMNEKLHNIDSIRLLGFTEKGQAYLSQIKQSLSIPLITNINRHTGEELEYDIKAGEVYRLADENRIPSQDYKRKPIKIN
ncbi:nucleotidyltransferase [Alkalibacterium iburiense]|uniref:tRNA(Met) cytidine acetate ligase n=1 Tax=Alkalibacterium iburiense TaxID=290589 RepID=A0ABN0XJ50_9LACT